MLITSKIVVDVDEELDDLARMTKSSRREFPTDGAN
jgi:hypothetical protein